MLSPAQLEMLRNLIHQRTGVYYPPKKDYLLNARILTLTREWGHANAASLLEAIRKDTGELWQEFIKSFTTNHTYFCRETEHFEFLCEHLRRARIHQPRIWIAAASTGEEVYTLAMYLQEAGYGNYRILASDINRQNLLTLRAGVYPSGRLTGVPREWKRRWFTEERSDEGHRFRVRPELKEHIYLKTLNLVDYLDFTSPFHAILCRNVLMYFQPSTQVRVVRTLADNLEPGGLLFLGMSENIGTLGLDWLLHTRAVAVYEKGRSHGIH